MTQKEIDDFNAQYPKMGVLGHEGEYKPRYGLWLNTSPECKTAVQGILAEGFTCDVVLKLGFRCSNHQHKAFRPVIDLALYASTIMHGADLEENCAGSPQCYVREVFFPVKLNLRRRRDLGAIGAQSWK